MPCLSFALSIRQHLPCSLDNLFHNRDVIITRNNNDNTLFTTPFEVTGYYCFIISLFRYHQYSCFNQEPFDDRDSPIVSYHLPLVIRAHTPAISNFWPVHPPSPHHSGSLGREPTKIIPQTVLNHSSLQSTFLTPHTDRGNSSSKDYLYHLTLHFDPPPYSHWPATRVTKLKKLTRE